MRGNGFYDRHEILFYGQTAFEIPSPPFAIEILETQDLEDHYFVFREENARIEYLNPRLVDAETARYIFIYYSNLLLEKESLAWRHYTSILKLEGNKNPGMVDLYKKKGWLTEDKSALDLLKDGYDHFEIITAKRILYEHREKVFLNNCPNCGKLARTPMAKQCPHCGFNWHKQ